MGKVRAGGRWGGAQRRKAAAEMCGGGEEKRRSWGNRHERGGMAGMAAKGVKARENKVDNDPKQREGGQQGQKCMSNKVGSGVVGVRC